MKRKESIDRKNRIIIKDNREKLKEAKNRFHESEKCTGIKWWYNEFFFWKVIWMQAT